MTRLLPRLVCCTLVLVASWSLQGAARAAEGPTRVVVEIGDHSSEKLDAKLVRRLVRLELADIAIPPPYDGPLTEPAPPLYIRIVDQDTYVSVELWERGLLRGERRVSVRAGAQLTARSIALVAAELAQRFSERRRLEARARALREARARKRSMEKRGHPLFARLALTASVEAATIGGDQAWLVGPGVDAALRFDNQMRIGLRMRGFMGRAEEERLQWLELGLSPGYAVELSRRTSLSAELLAAGAAFSVPGATLLDDSRSTTTWNARATAGVNLSHRFHGELQATLGLDGGSTLRKVPLSVDGRERWVGGLWLGAQLGLVLDHVVPR